MTVGQGVLRAVLDVGAVDAVESRLEQQEVLRSAAHARRVRPRARARRADRRKRPDRADRGEHLPDDPAGLELRAHDTEPADDHDRTGEHIQHTDTRWSLELDNPYLWLR
jgi:hypothetical protein